MDTNAHRFLLKSAGDQVEAARKALEKAMNNAKREALLAENTDLSIVEISKLTQLSRMTIYKAMEEDIT